MMKAKRIACILQVKLFAGALMLFISIKGFAQKQFIHTATKANNSCNGDCTLLDVPDLNNNPDAIILVTPLPEDGLNLNPHPIGVFYFKKQWNIFNLDQRAINAGAKFNVEYVTRPDANHFRYAIINKNIGKDGAAFIDHPDLNNHPGARFSTLVSWNPEIQGGAANREATDIQYNADAGKWSIYNTNRKTLFAGVAYNIIIFKEENPLPGQGKEDPVISKTDPKTYKNPADTVPVISKIVPKTKIKTEDTAGVIDSPADNKGIIPKKTIAPSYDFSHVHVCIETITNKHLPPKPPVIPFRVIPKINSNGVLQPVTTSTQPLSVANDLMWSPGETISVGFLPGETLSVINKLKNYVKEWETYANIKFVFINDMSQAKIKVGFKKNGLSWSWIGRDILVNLNEGSTMNLGWLDDHTPGAEFRRVVLHEFGHALGFIHEHQSPNAGIPWDTAKVYSYYGGSPNNWSRATIEANIFQKYSVTSTNSSTYDKLSIMHYSFPPELTTDSSFVDNNTDLSATDKDFAGKVYPYPPAQATATGVLLTGDDCDEIEFKIEYDVVNNSEIAFFLEPGRDRNNNILNWWKKIAIPVVGGEVGIEMQDGYSATNKVSVSLIDKARGIAFGKAKVLGVHTGLGFTWNVWPAIIGGCRVTFVWRRDSCKQ